MIRQPNLTSKRQRGAVLLIALIMLLLLTIIGMAGMRDTNMQEKMAGNLRDQNLAFQAAEAGLRFAEQQAKGQYNSLNQLELVDNQPTVFIRDAVYEGFTEGVYAEPTYTITKLPHPGPLDMQDIVNPQTTGGESLAAGEAMILDFVLVRIESTGTGMSPDAKVKLRSLYFVEE